MRASFLHIQPLAELVLVADVPGAFAEFGVWHGTTFLPLAELARQNQRDIHAVDSFAGMGPGSERDDGQYSEGALTVGGSASFRSAVSHLPNVKIHEGFIPGILRELADVRFSFVHLDLDQYAPTKESLEFLWPRMSPGGIIVCHDYFSGSAKLASGAIADWAHIQKVPISGVFAMSRHCWFVRPAG